LRNSNKQHLILAKLFYGNNAPIIGSQNAKFWLNPSKPPTGTAAFVRSSRNTLVSGSYV